MAWYKNIGTWKDLLTILGIVVGGLWAYFKFFKGRTFKPRLELKVSGKIITFGNVQSLAVLMEIKNIGLSQVYLDRDLIRLDFETTEQLTNPPQARQAAWRNLQSFPTFPDHGWVESEETICDSLLIELPNIQPVTYKLKLVVRSQWPAIREKWRSWRRRKERGGEWSTTSIAQLEVND